MRFTRTAVVACVIAPLLACVSAAPRDGAVVQTFDLAAFSARFEAGSVIGVPRLVDCTLSEGTPAQCVSVTLPADPASFEIGPWCPTNIRDGAEKGGIWLDDGKVYDVDGSFIENLARFYGDSTWQMFDPQTGAVKVTDSKAACEAAARPDVDPRYVNHCVQCLASYIEEGLTNTYVIPIEPVRAARLAPRVGHDGVGIAYSGLRLDAAAPTEAILGAHTLAPFDDCGGHVNPNVGYHVHAVTDCLRQAPATGTHAAEIGVALDGYPLYATLSFDGSAPQDLDACRGHSTAGEGYHYHAGSAGSNAILGCHTGQTGCVLTDPDATCDASAVQRPQGPPRGPGRGDRPPRP